MMFIIAWSNMSQSLKTTSLWVLQGSKYLFCINYSDCLRNSRTLRKWNMLSKVFKSLRTTKWQRSLLVNFNSKVNPFPLNILCSTTWTKFRWCVSNLFESVSRFWKIYFDPYAVPWQSAGRAGHFIHSQWKCVSSKHEDQIKSNRKQSQLNNVDAWL